ncbi:SGT1 protein-domain-containing protein [Gymnopilus junonius]|uniref:SGT1 protein-domain-containing protein n=1 Tax=Gymnopilus junonius TaxID=109634 RepID=A0A9P5TJE9_GYMJU|nr:SGT1 protein-domain-containing protein [Gymnopilus junonius]
MDIFNRPHSIADDTLHYIIYPPPNLSDKLSVISLAASISSYVETLLPDFIWHRDKFEVKLAPNPDGQAWVLESRMRVGDCVDDEWLAVWLLKQISSNWDVVISVYDSDGEFLLIEAAEGLPSWVKPTNSENRVWIHNSRLHLIPLSHNSPPSRQRRRRKLPGAADSDDDAEVDNEDFIAGEDAIKLVRNSSIDTLAPAEVEKIVWQRISGYPEAAKTHVHVTKAYLPIDISKALVANPALVQKAVETFYTRDAIQLRAAHRMSRFSPDKIILTSVEMTRTAYAQIESQKFFPPKVFGRWQVKEGTKEWKWRDVGMKIAVGFEMLYQESKSRINAQIVFPENAEAFKEALRRDPHYEKYIQNLVSAGYFRGEIQGSELWNQLESRAAATYHEVRRTDDATRQSFTSQVDEALSRRDLRDHLDREEDPDDWLTVDAQEFEQMLENTLKRRKAGDQKDQNAMDVDVNDLAFDEDRIASQQAGQLKDLASKVEDFIQGKGELEGALFEDEKVSDDELLSEDEDFSESESEPETPPQSREARSADAQAAMDKLVPALEPSEYGKMPPHFHSGSQRVASTGVETDTIEESVKKQGDGDEKPNLKQRPIRPPIIPRDRYEGVDSDDESDEEGVEDDESEEDRPQVVGEIEINMAEEEEEFLEFSRQALGITDEQWSDIIKDRKERDAFIPASVTKSTTTAKKLSEKVENSERKAHVPRVPQPGSRPNANPDLDSFEAVMKALDEALETSRRSTRTEKKGENSKGKEKAKYEDPMDVDEEEPLDIEAAMERELKSALEGYDSDSEQPADYGMIKNLLESFKSQEGLSGPFSNLAGRLMPEFKLPRDES